MTMTRNIIIGALLLLMLADAALAHGPFRAVPLGDPDHGPAVRVAQQCILRNDHCRAAGIDLQDGARRHARRESPVGIVEIDACEKGPAARVTDGDDPIDLAIENGIG